MKILHVSMGIPPFRVGGLNEYCLELMEQQVLNGDTVTLLYPGEFGIRRKIKIIQDKKYYLKNGQSIKKSKEYSSKENLFPKVDLYRITNPLPLSLIFGINDPKRYMQKCDKQIYIDFINKINPDIIHIHCLQGIHKEFFEAAHDLGKRMIFTTHDYYPICPKCSLYNEESGICDEIFFDKCASCNMNRGLSKKQEIIMQSKLYSKLKYNKVLKKIRRISRKNLSKSLENMDLIKCTRKYEVNKEKINLYKELFNYYNEIISFVDVVHCNSNLAQSIYQKYFPNLNYCVVPITRKNLGSDKVKINSKLQSKFKDNNKIIIGYVGGVNLSKGLKTLIDAITNHEEISELNWELHLYGGDYIYEESLDKRIVNCGFYNKENRNEVYSSFNVLIVPSLWPETFGFIVPEALSVGIPVICSNMVGSKDYIEETSNEKDSCKKDSIFIFKAGDSKELAKKILTVVTNNISFNVKSIDTMEEHSKKIQEKIYK